MGVAALDPFRGYATALRTQLPAAVRVLDAFHVVKLGFDAVDEVRRRVQQDTFGHRGRAGDPLYGIRRVLRRGHDHHGDRSWNRLLRGLDLGDPNGEVAAAWIAAQELRLLYRLRDPHRAAQGVHPLADLLRRLVAPGVQGAGQPVGPCSGCRCR